MAEIDRSFSASAVQQIEERQLRGHSGVAQHLDPVALALASLVVFLDFGFLRGTEFGRLGRRHEEGEQTGQEAVTGNGQDDGEQETANRSASVDAFATQPVDHEQDGNEHGEQPAEWWDCRSVYYKKSN